MFKQNSRLTLAVVLVAATMLVAGSVAVASNTGFKINKPLPVTSAANPNIGNSWVSIPYFHPYTNGNVLCQQLGLRSAPLQVPAAALTKVDPITGVATTVNCGSAAAFTWLPGQGVRIRNTAGAGAPTSAIIVGSHNPALTLTLPDTSAANGNIGNFWFAVPYHTTAVTAQDICNQVGMFSTGVRGSVLSPNAALGTGTPANCGTAQATGLVLELGAAVRLRDSNGPFSFVPAHF
jgi:hypothetical protein